MEYIGISENRLHHILGVASKSYSIAKSEGHDEGFCRKMFMIGWCHDVGYEFSHIQEEHPNISAQMLLELINGCQDRKCIDSAYVQAVKRHGTIPEDASLRTDEWRILNMADMTTDSEGNDVDVAYRLADIETRYGTDSEQFRIACDVCHEIGLV